MSPTATATAEPAIAVDIADVASAATAAVRTTTAERAPREPAGCGASEVGTSPAGAATTVEFSRAARVLAYEARRQRLAAPSFRCPPRMVGVQRTVRRHATGGIVAVQVRGRPWAAVVADMIEGVVVVNRLLPPEADRVRTALWRVVEAGWPVVAAEGSAAGSVATVARVA